MCPLALHPTTRGLTGSSTGWLCACSCRSLRGTSTLWNEEAKMSCATSFPLMFCANNLLMILYRLAEIDGHQWDRRLLAVATCIYALSGFCDTLLYGYTRNIISLPAVHRLSFASAHTPRSSVHWHHRPLRSPATPSPKHAEFKSERPGHEDVELQVDSKARMSPVVSHDSIWGTP